MLNYYYTFKKKESATTSMSIFVFCFFFCSVLFPLFFRFLIKKEYVFDFFSIVGFLLPGDYFEIFVLLLLFISLKYYYILYKKPPFFL